MKTKETEKRETIETLKEKASKLPLGFIIGAAIGGGLFLYSTRNRGSKTVNAFTNLAKLAAPYVIVTILDKVVENYKDKQGYEIEETKVLIS